MLIIPLLGMDILFSLNAFNGKREKFEKGDLRSFKSTQCSATPSTAISQGPKGGRHNLFAKENDKFNPPTAWIVPPTRQISASRQPRNCAALPIPQPRADLSTYCTQDSTVTKGNTQTDRYTMYSDGHENVQLVKIHFKLVCVFFLLV